MTGRAWGRLFRLSLFPTAVADVLAGLLLGHGGALPGARDTLLLVAASLCVYHAGMALNDWADRHADAATRPDRPLVRGAVAPRSALLGVVALNLAGLSLAVLAAPRAALLLAAVAGLATLYDLRGRGPWLGPLLLALCRAGNLGLGIAHAGAPDLPAVLAAPLLYGAYVFTVSRLGRLEDREDRDLAPRRPRSLLALAAVLLTAVVLLPVESATVASRLGALLLGAGGAAGLLRRALSVSTWTPGAVGAAMGLALRRLLVFTAACALLTGTPTGWVVGAGILLGFPISWSLRGIFPPS